MKTYLARRLQTLAWLTLAAFVIGQLGTLHWFAELFSHFVPHYAAVFALAALCLHNRWRYLWAAWALALTAWTLWPPVLDPPDKAATRLIWYNVNLDNRDARGESARLIAENADILALAEIQLRDPGWQPLRQHYPHGCAHEDSSPFALAVFAREPLAACDIFFPGEYPAIRAVLRDGRVLYAAHPPPPINADLASARVDYLRILADRLAAENSALLVGDLNSSPYSPHYRALLRATTRNILPTWLPLGLNLDHALVRHGQAHSKALPWHTSDHRPLHIQWSLP
ncbi:endonuclease/exonuclease/phosphatase family protein [Cardiobacterium hominis]|uniref:endonuclease/exonuclease/phosphatase family protein n=1 Tax=Cardiobacterium hominis TaxID=2718 RepID=UPI0028E8CB51|nr:endonuclease/exonuclease/phosphatase family protein [Cardiobacterium hominis]